MQIRATAFEGESVSVTDLLADSLALTGCEARRGGCARGRDTSPTVVKFPALAVLLMVSEGSEVQLCDSAQRHREVQARRAPDALRGRAEEGAGDAHVVVVGRADVHHQVGGRAQPVPAAEGVASPRRQRV